MSSGALIALCLFAAGAAALLVWLLQTIDNPRRAALLRKSMVFFILPGALLVAIQFVAPLPLIVPLHPLLIILLLMLIEEFLKFSAARSEQRPADKFALAMLFGIFELLLSKPIGPLLGGAFYGEWSRWGYVGITLGGLLALLMHSVTAALYAFRFTRRRWVGLIACFALHTTYNMAMLITMGNVWVVAVAAVMLGISLIVLLPNPDGEAATSGSPGLVIEAGG
jgi:hypothetical protein